MRGLIAIPLSIALAAAMGIVICNSADWDPHRREMLYTISITVAASLIALVPLILTRGARQDAVAQAGLVGTMLHMFGCVAGAAVVLLQKLTNESSSFIYWLLTFYGVSLIGVVACYVKAVNKALPPQPSVATPRTTEEQNARK